MGLNKIVRVFLILIILAPFNVRAFSQTELFSLNMSNYLELTAQNYVPSFDAISPAAQFIQPTFLLKNAEQRHYSKILSAYRQSLILQDSIEYLCDAKTHLLQWQFLYEKQALRYQLITELRNWENKTELRFELGDLSLSEFLTIQSFFIEQENLYLFETDDLMTEAWKIRQFTGLVNYDIIPSTNDYVLYETDKNFQHAIININKHKSEQETQLLVFILEHHKSNVFHRQINNQLGVLEKNLALKEQTTIANRITFDFEKEHLKAELHSLFAVIKDFEQTKLAEGLIKKEKTALRFKEEDITYETYVKTVYEQFMLQISYLELIHRYNLTALQLERHAF